MAILPVSGLADMGQAAEGNYVRFDEFADAIERMGHALKEIDCSAGGTITLTKGAGGSFIEGYAFKLTGAPAAAFTLSVPDGERRFEVWNTSGRSATVDTATGSAATIVVRDGERKTIVAEGTDLRLHAELSFRIGTFQSGKPGAGQEMLRFKAPFDFTLKAGLPGARAASSAGAADADKAFSLRKNGVEFGTVTFETSGAVAFVAASDTAFGDDTDVLTIVAPAVQDSTLADVSIILTGLR